MPLTHPTIHIVGAGLAGSECALQLAERGYNVVLYEMRAGGTLTPAHKTQKFGELVCSNSFGSLADTSATGQLKWEASQLGSHILACAKLSQVPAGQALAMDREMFSQLVTDRIRANPRIRVEPRLIESLDEIPRPAVLATGPLTHTSLAQSLQKFFGEEFLFFYDAIAPIIDADSIDHTVAWRQDRYDKGTPDYLNCPMEREQYESFIAAVRAARKVEPKEFEKDIPYFESCLPIEVLAERGLDTPRFGPMKPKGLRDPRTGKRPWAVVQLRQDNQAGTAFNMVGFQTKMAYGEQERVFRMIPGLERAEFLKLGSIHRNLYVNSTKQLSFDFSTRKDPGLFLAGQITGVEGYFDSTMTGLWVALSVDRRLRGLPPARMSRDTALGSLIYAVTGEEKSQFQPTNINFGLFPRPAKDMSPADRKVVQIQQARSHFPENYLEITPQ